MTGYKGYVTKANDHDQKADGFKDLAKAVKKMGSISAAAGQVSQRKRKFYKAKAQIIIMT